MFLYVNTPGARSFVVNTFGELAKSFEKLTRNESYQISILNPSSPGKYDMILHFVYEPISGGRFVRGYIFKNPTGIVYCRPTLESTSLLAMGLFSPLMSAQQEPLVKERMPISDFFPQDFLKSEHIPLGVPLPATDLDSYETLTARADAFFMPPPKTASD